MVPIILIAIVVSVSWTVMFATVPGRRSRAVGPANRDIATWLNLLFGFGFLYAGYRIQAVLAMFTQLIAAAVGIGFAVLFFFWALATCTPDWWQDIDPAPDASHPCEESVPVLIVGLLAPAVLPALAVAGAWMAYTRKLLR